MVCLRETAAWPACTAEHEHVGFFPPLFFKVVQWRLSPVSVMVGFWQLYRAITNIWRLQQSLIYLIGGLPAPH